MKRALLAFLLPVLFVSAATGQTTVFIVRHAEKAAGNGDDPDLSEAGRARAESLVKNLKDANITAIYVTEFKRTQETAAPLATSLGIEVTIVPAKESAALAAKLRDLRGNALVVGHGNTIPDLIKALGIPSAVNISESDYDNLFVIARAEKARLIRLHY